MSLQRSTVLGLFILALATVRAAAEPCPTNCVRLVGFPSFEWCTTGAALDTCGEGCAGFDTRAGTFHASAGRGRYASTTPADDFTVIGPATSTPLAFQLAVHVTGNVEPPCREDPETFASVALLIREGSSNQVAWNSDTVPNCEENRDFDRTFNLPIQRLVGETFRVLVGAEAIPSIYGGARIEGIYDFIGLPPEYSIVSCQGFTSTPIAVLEGTWGRVKSIYR